MFLDDSAALIPIIKIGACIGNDTLKFIDCRIDMSGYGLRYTFGVPRCREINDDCFSAFSSPSFVIDESLVEQPTREMAPIKATIVKNALFIVLLLLMLLSSFDNQLSEPLDHGRILMAEERRCLRVQSLDEFHVIVVEFKGIDVEIFTNSFLMGRFRQ